MTRWRQARMPAPHARKWTARPPARPRRTASNGGTPARSERNVTAIRPTRPARARRRRMLRRARGCAMTDTASAEAASFAGCFFFAISGAHPQLGALLLGDVPAQPVLVRAGDVVDAD